MNPTFFEVLARLITQIAGQSKFLERDNKNYMAQMVGWSPWLLEQSVNTSRLTPFWELFTQFAIQASNGKLLSMDMSTRTFVSKASTAGQLETFTLKMNGGYTGHGIDLLCYYDYNRPQNDGYFSILPKHQNRVEADYYRSQGEGWVVIDLGQPDVAFRYSSVSAGSNHGYYLYVEDSGKLSISAGMEPTRGRFTLVGPSIADCQRHCQELKIYAPGQLILDLGQGEFVTTKWDLTSGYIEAKASDSAPVSIDPEESKMNAPCFIVTHVDGCFIHTVSAQDSDPSVTFLDPGTLVSIRVSDQDAIQLKDRNGDWCKMENGSTVYVTKSGKFVPVKAKTPE